MKKKVRNKLRSTLLNLFNAAEPHTVICMNA